jgi:hypothetical protein
VPQDQHKWRGHDLVLYKSTNVSTDHKDVSDGALVCAQLFNTVGNTHTLTDLVWDTFLACDLSDVPLSAVSSTRGQINNTKGVGRGGYRGLVLTLDMDAFYESQVAECATVDLVSDDEGEQEAKYNPLFMTDVALKYCKVLREV